MASVITIAGEQLFAAKAQANEQLDIDTFIFANVPNQDPSAPINREEGIPTAHIVYQQNVQQVGRVNDNVVVYSTVLDSITGPFEFNWVGLYSSVNQKLVAINHVPTVTKTVTAPGEAGNTLNRNFGIEYSGIAALTNITVDASTWQLNFTARLSGMDKLTQQLAADMNGKDWFIDDGLKVVPRATANSFSVTPGVGYVSGLRVELKQEHILIVQTYPQFVYVDAWFSGNANSTWSPQLAFTVTNTEMDDYIDPSGTQHYVYKLAVINAADNAEDLRKKLSKHRIQTTVSEIKKGLFNVGDLLQVTDRLNSYFEIRNGNFYNELDILDAGESKVAELENKAKIDIRALGAVNGSVITSIMQRAIDISNEVNINSDVVGDYYIVDDTVHLVKNDGGRLTFRINSTNAVIVPTTGAAKPWLRIDDTIKIEIEGITAVSANRDSFIDAVLWNSKISNCFLEHWVHSNNPVGFYRQSFFNEWRDSTMLTISIHTGGGSNLAEFNNNTFTNVNFLSTDPFLKIYGSHGVEGLRFNYCTAETQTGDMIYIDEQCQGDITFNGCYLDAENSGIPFDTKGLVINLEGVCDVPVAAFNAKTSLANTMARVLDTTVKQPYIGSFEPIGLANYVKNGDLSENSASMVLGNFNTASVSYDNAALNGKRCVINFDASDACFLDSSPIKSDGYYSVIVIYRSSFDVNGYIDGVSGPTLFGTINATGGLETQVATCTFYAEAGAIPKITFVSTADGNNLLLDYACISHGKKAVLGPLKSVEKLSKLQEETGVVVANAGSIVKRFALSVFLRSSFTVDLYVEDFNAPDGVSYYKIAITTSETSASLNVVDSVVSGAPVTFSVSNQSGYFDLLATPNNGECTIRYKTLGYYRNIIV